MNASKGALRGYGLALLAATLWACGGLTAKWLEIDPLAMAGIRSIIAVFALGVVLLIFKRHAFRLRNPRKDIPLLFMFGIFGQAAMMFTYLMSIAHNPVGVAILMHYLAPVVSLIIGVVFLRHKPKLLAVGGVVLAVIGCALVVGIVNPAGMNVTTLGLFWGLASAVFFSLYAVMGAQVKERFSAFTLLFYGLAISAVVWLIAAGPIAVITPIFTTETALPLLAVGTLTTLLPFAAFLLALKYIPAVNAGITAMAEPILGVIGGALIFAELITGSFIFGGILILAAIAVIQISDAWS
ncbi:MAG: DMT family transporter [Coriobacteriia bacterium]|nr:DMT family transporter [Coriobacteriia bacterium]